MSKMFRTFTLALLGLLLLTGAARSVYAQCDPRFSGTLYTGTSSPSNIATILAGETATLNFNFGVGPLSGCTATAGNIPGAITITISFPPNYGPSSSVVTGPQASLYDWTYDPVTNKLTGVNNALIPRGGSALFELSVVGLIPTPGLGTPLTDFQFTSTTSPPITDGNTGNNTATIGLNVDPAPPVTLPDTKTTVAGTPTVISVLTNDTQGTDPIAPGTVLIIDPADNTPKTSVTIPGEGTYTVNTTTGEVTFTPIPTFTGTATPVSYTVKDVNGLISNPSTITVTVTPATPPVAVADAASTPNNTPVTVSIPANDTPGSAALDPTSVKLIDPVSGLPVNTVTVAGQGTYTVDPLTGAVTFVPLPTFSGVATPVNYTINDVNGVTSNQAPITITVAPATPPVAVADAASTPNNTPVTVSIPANDTPGSAALDPTSVKLIDPVSGLPVNTVTVAGEGTYTVDPLTGAVTFVPLPTFSGVATPVNYTINDVNGVTSNQAPITITVAPATPPVAVADAASTPNNTPVTVSIPANDTPGSAALDPTSVKLIDPVSGLPVNTVTVAGQGTYTVDPLTGAVTFVPLPTFSGVATPVNYTINDVNGVTSNQAPITITVAPATPPVAVADAGSSTPVAPAIIPILTNDIPGSSPLDPTSVKLIDPVTGLPTLIVTIPNEGTYTVDPITGVVTFVQDPAITTPITSTVTYTVTDVNGLTSNPATITVNATPLPVTLTTFKVSKEGQTAKLNWATTEETNSDYFEIQHSVTGKEWANVGQVTSSGESKVLKNYSFSHVNPVHGQNLYRLKMVDKDATYAYSRIQSVKFDGLNTVAVSVYPNPSADKVFIQDLDLTQVKQVSIMDMNGRALFSNNKVTADGINVSKFRPGTYMLHIMNNNGTTSNHKIVIVR